MTPAVSMGTRIIDCCRYVSASGSVLPITTRMRQRGSIAPVLHHFASVDHVLVAVADDAGGDIAGVARGHVWFGHGEGGSDIAREQRGQPLLLLLGAAEHVQDLHVAGVGCRAVDRLGAISGIARDLGHLGIVDDIETVGRVIAVGQEQVPQTPAPGFALQGGHHLGQIHGRPASMFAWRCA